MVEGLINENPVFIPEDIQAVSLFHYAAQYLITDPSVRRCIAERTVALGSRFWIDTIRRKPGNLVAQETFWAETREGGG